MVRSYEVCFHLDEYVAGWYLYCFEDDNMIHERFFRDRQDAEEMGEKFLDGQYVSIKVDA